jgi:hypothetical protein
MRRGFMHYIFLLLGISFIIFPVSCAEKRGPDIKTGPDIQWCKLFGEGTDVYGSSIRQTSDGGYVVFGREYSYQKSNEGGAWLIKTDADGNMVWEKIFNGSEGTFGDAVQQTTDGGYILCGTIIKAEEVGSYCMWLIKTDAEGNKLWDRTFVSSKRGAWGHSVQQTTDGGYILCGQSDDRTRLIKTDAEGNTVWDKILASRNSTDSGNSVRQTVDGGYIVCGVTWPSVVNGPDIYKPNVWLVKTDADGNKVWDWAFGGEMYASASEVEQTTDGGYITCGIGETNTGKLGGLVIKIDSDGNKIWDKTFSRGSMYSIQQAANGDYIMCGESHYSAWLIKIDGEGNELWEEEFDCHAGFTRAYSIRRTTDGGYITCGQGLSGSCRLLLSKIAPEQ